MRFGRHHLDRAGMFRTLRYVLVGSSTLGFDLLLLYTLVNTFGVSFVIATPVCFCIAASINYLVSRRFVFTRTERSLVHGYGYFAALAACGAFITTVLVAGFVTYLALPFLAARVCAAGLVGIGNYLFNLHVTFRVAGRH